MYETLCHAHAAAVHALKPGQPLSEVYAAAQKSIAASDRPDLAQYLSSRVGNGIGLEFREHLFLSAQEKRHAKANMTFALSLGFANVPHKGAKAGKSGAQALAAYSVQVGDVVHLRASASEKTGEWADVLTGGKMNWNAVHFQLEEEESEESAEEEEEGGARADRISRGRSSRLAARAEDAARGGGGVASSATKQADQQSKQESLMREKADRMLSSFGAAGGDGAAAAADEAKQIEWVPPYATPAAYPSDVAATRIYVDTAHDAVFLPLNGIPTPFTIKCIKNVTLTDSDGAGETILKFDFYIPPKTTAATAPKECAPAMVQVLHDLHILGAGAEAARDVAWVKVLSFRARDGENLRNVERMVKAIQKRMRAKVRDDRELLDIVQQAPLAVSARKVSLTDLEMRPNLNKRKTTGACEIHKNGIRFRSKHWLMCAVV